MTKLAIHTPFPFFDRDEFLTPFDKMFDSFPVFSNDGKYLIFSSNRNNGGNRDTNIFVAEWQD